jgi:hypothetical protein
MMRACFIASFAVASACTPPSPIGQTYKASIKIESQTGCPMFVGLSTRLDRDLVFTLEQRAVRYDRANGEPYDVMVSDPDDNGRCSVGFTVDETWTTGTTPVPVTIVYVGTAIFDNLDLIGTVSFPAPSPLTDGCVMTLAVFGFEEG